MPAEDTELDVFTKLSLILENSSFKDDIPLKSSSQPSSSSSSHLLSSSSSPSSPAKTATSPTSQVTDRPTPYEVWKSRQKNNEKYRATPRLNGKQWDHLVDKMHHVSRTKQSVMAKQQNEGLAAELGGFEFKPRMNKVSLDLAKSMQKIQMRLPQMIAEKKANLEKKRKQQEEEELAQCTFSPVREGSKLSQKLLEKRNRHRRTPDEMIAHRDEKLRRDEQRRQIIQEIESRELTFQPKLPASSHKMHDKLFSNNHMERDPITRTTKVINTAKQRRDEENSMQLHEIAPLILESDHPYKHNSDDYTIIYVPNAVSYSISFDPQTATESIYDYVKFYHDDTHTVFWGNGKYHGGVGNTSSNWPGVNGRPPLIIPAGRFVVYFKSNTTVNGWGFKMKITPSVMNHPNKDSDSTSGKPEISKIAKSMHLEGNVHERLYKSGIGKVVAQANFCAEMMQAKLNLSLRPWEGKRDSEGGNPWATTRTHTKKVFYTAEVGDMLLDSTGAASRGSNDGGRGFTSKDFVYAEFDLELGMIWRSLRTCTPLPADEISTDTTDL